ncbi:MAG: N-acetylneuraminate synthase [Phycisphaerales bacterium]|nr:N-acetylneuraminate synthase [Phycisphaerales bacterium]
MTTASFHIAGRTLGSGGAPFIIAEIGVNHDGSMERACSLIHAAKAAGASAAKFQMFDASMLMSLDAVLAVYQRERGARDPRELLQQLQLSPSDLGTLAEECRDAGIYPIVTVFSLPLVPYAAAQCWHAFKMASPDLVNRPLLRAMAQLGRPLIVSTGAATREEVAQGAAWLSDIEQVAFLQCTSSYPTSDACAAIGGMHEVASITRRVVGYSDHTQSIDAGALAVAAGACILEKHLTYDCSAHGPDHAASLNPAQFKEYVQLANRAAILLSSPHKLLQDVERDVRSVSRQSLVATRDLAEGHAITAHDLACKRPGTGIPVAELEATVGRVLRRAVACDRVLHLEDLA